MALEADGLIAQDEIEAWARSKGQKEAVESLAKVKKRYGPLIEQAKQEAELQATPGAGAGRRIGF